MTLRFLYPPRREGAVGEEEVAAFWSMVATAVGAVLAEREDARWLLGTAGQDGRDLLPHVARLAAIDPAGLSGPARVELIRALERARAQVEGAQQVALAAVAEATVAAGFEGEAARHEVGAALRLSPGTAASRAWVAQRLVGRHPATLAALRAGRISYLQARHLVEAVKDLEEDTAAAVEARVLPGMAGETLGETRASVAHAIADLDAEGAAARHAKARDARRITRHRQPEAMEAWWLTMPAHHAAAAWQALTARARATQRLLREQAGIDPGLDALRVDALVDALLGHPDPAAAPASRPAAAAGGAGGAGGAGDAEPWLGGPLLPRCSCGGAPTAAVVIDLPTLLGLADTPGELPGYGAIPAAMARELAATCHWERWIVDPVTRELLDRGGRRYRPGPRLRRFVVAARRTCAFPGCSRAAERCDLDHRITFRRGGRTIERNLGPLCRQHHNAKTHGGWHLRYDPDWDEWTWISPLGQTYPATSDPPLRL